MRTITTDTLPTVQHLWGRLREKNVRVIMIALYLIENFHDHNLLLRLCFDLCFDPCLGNPENVAPKQLCSHQRIEQYLRTTRTWQCLQT